MANLQDIKRRITSVKSTQKITKAMKMVAAAKLRRAQETIVKARPYAHRMRELVNNLSTRANLDLQPLLAKGSGNGPVGLVVVTSDRGLCGAFNSSIVQKALHTANTEKDTGREVQLTMIGRKGAELLARRYGSLHATHEDVMEGSPFDAAGSIVSGLASEFAAGEAGEIFCIYNEFKSAISQTVTVERLLPFEPKPPEEGASAVDYIYEPSSTAVFGDLLTRHLQIQMHRILFESAASEHGARMTAMDSATTNAGEMIDRLTLQYNRARQDAITTELIEVVSGSEAL